MQPPAQDQLARGGGCGARPRLDPADPICAALLVNVLDAAAAAIAVLSGAELRFEVANAAYRALTPCPDVDPLGLRYEEVWTGEAPVSVLALRRVLETRAPWRGEDHVFRVPAGATRRFSSHVKAIPWRGGEQAVLVALWETTALWEARHEAEEAARREALRASELGAVLEALPDALVLYGRRGEIVRMNVAAARFIAFAPGEESLPIAERAARMRMFAEGNGPLSPEDAPAVRALRGETVRSAHLRVESPSGTRWVLASAAPIRAPDGSPAGAVLTFSDESDLHHLEAARDDLVRMVSHDLRTPLNTILAQAHLLRSERGDPAKVRERARSITRSCERMRSMIQDLLEATLLEAGQLRTVPVELDLAEFVREVLERHRGTLTVERVRVEAPGRVLASGDAERLERILVNLLSNALKYSPGEAEVTVRVARVEGGASLAVSDRGVGIAPEDLPHVFERFFRARGARQPEGLGLGLYITRLLAYAHGGRIDVESQLGCGSTFRVFLPDRLPLPMTLPGT